MDILGEVISMIQKIIKQIKYNITPHPRKIEDIKYVVMHYTANYDKYSDDNANADYFSRESSRASADYIVDCDSYTQVNDYLKNYCWSVGDGKGKYGITNANSISVEMCVNKELDKVIENTIEILQNDILPKFPHIGYNNLIRHYDASRKLCPIFFVNTNIKDIDPRWLKFKNKVFKFNNNQDEIQWRLIILNNSNDGLNWLSKFDDLIKNHSIEFQHLPKLIEKIYMHNKNA
jgi:N-acetylmuramoyl-L-alanine amidase